MDHKFGSGFLPSVVHGLAPVNVDVNSRNVGLLLMVDRMVGGSIVLLC